MSGMKTENIEPPTKMIKLFNGAVAPVDNKDNNNKMVQLALSQVRILIFPKWNETKDKFINRLWAEAD